MTTHDHPPIEITVPDGPPSLDRSGWRALLGILVGVAETEMGPDWRDALADRSESAR